MPVPGREPRPFNSAGQRASIRARKKGRISAVVLALAITVGTAGCITDTSAGPGQSPTDNSGAHADATSYVNICHGHDCWLYLSRSQTRQLSSNIGLEGGGVAGLAATCTLFTLISGPVGVIVAVACGAGIGMYGSVIVNTIVRAAAADGCLRIDYLKLFGIPVPGGMTFHVDNSRYCHNT